MKRVLIDGTTLSKKTDGLSQYILSIVDRLESNEACDYTLLINKNFQYPEEEQLRLKGIKIETAAINPIGPLRDLQFAFYLLRNKKKYDSALILSNQYPALFNIPAIYTIHDLIYEEFPKQLGRLSAIKKWYLHQVVKRGIKKSKKIIAVSEFTKSEIIRIHQPKNTEKIAVVYEGWEHLCKTYQALPFDQPFGKYILYVGSSRGHKNIQKLLEAIELIQDELPADYGFVFVGNTSFLNHEQKQKIHNFNVKKKIIHFTNWITDSELNNYFKNANAFIFPSLSEGFGIPILEAFYHKIPALLSMRASLPEVGGDAAIYFNPVDKKDIGEKILYFINNEEKISSELIEKGQKRLALFSWKETADKIISYI